jgi:uncharacterized membrane protein YcaP (DUF421 family)
MKVDWQHLLVPTESLVELVIRGSAMYLLLFAALRILGRRHVGSLSMMDLLLMVLIADAAQNAMAAEYTSITEGLVLCGTLLGWNYLLDWLAFTFPWMDRILEPSSLPIIIRGKFIRKNLKAELLTPDEVLGQLREQEIFDIAEVELAYVESDGGLSVKRYDKSKTTPNPDSNQSSLR